MSRISMADALSILLSQFRRRLILARGLRLAATAAALVAAACLAGALTERVSEGPLARIVFVAIIAAGLPAIFRLRHMPTLAAAALEIDRQKDLRELLSSAVLADGREDLSYCVLVAARQKATKVDVSQLKAGSAGTRMWITTLLIAGLLPLLYRSSAGTSVEPTNTITSVETQAQRASLRTTTSAGSEQRRPTQTGETSSASAITVASASDRQRPVDAGRRPTRSDTAGLSAGGGLAQESTAAPPTSPMAATPAVSDPGEGGAPGSGTARANSTGTDDGIGQVTSRRGQINTGNRSPTVTKEQGTVNAESFPEAYRDVLKAYFAR